MIRPLEAMTVGELKEYLEEFPDSQKVGFSYPTGDFWRTEVFVGIQSAEYATVAWSEHSRAYRLVDEDDRQDNPREEVLILG